MLELVLLYSLSCTTCGRHAFKLQNLIISKDGYEYFPFARIAYFGSNKLYAFLWDN
jgi:hypothetical protein